MVADRPAPESPEPAVDTNSLNAEVPRIVSAPADVTAELTQQSLRDPAEVSYSEPLAVERPDAEPALPDDRILSEPADTAEYEPFELEDTLDVQTRIGEPEVWMVPDDMTRITVEHHKDDLHMDLNDALGPGVPRTGGY
jgi:hypothetical protein